MIITAIQLLVFISYVGYLIYKFKKPLPSISDSFYQLNGYKSNLFVAFTFILGGLMTQQSESLWFFFSGVGLAFVGAACMFKWTSAGVDKVHYAGAASGIILALLGLGFVNGLWLPLIIWLVSTIAMKLLKINNFTWWVEISAFVTIMAGLLYR